MKCLFAVFSLLFFYFSASTQTSITAITTSSAASPTSSTYSSAGKTYNWAVNPNNSTVYLDGFTSGGIGYTYASFVTGAVKLRRVDNPNVFGNFSLIWVEAAISGSTFNMFTEYQNDLEQYFNNRIYNKGTDNFLDNTSGNCNNVERLDWIVAAGYSTNFPAKTGFAIFERGASGQHDPFCIAAITSLDGSGNPATYSNIVRVATSKYGELGPNVTYEILKGNVPANLLDAGTATQSRGGVIVSLQDLGITANTRVYGYSLFANDLPLAATPADLIDYTNSTNFPRNSAAPGGIDLIAITGVSVQTSILPTRFTSFNGVENNNNINLKWKVENEISVDHYDIERSTNGIHFLKISESKSAANSTGANLYSFTDNVVSVPSNEFYYRIKEYDRTGSWYLSKTIAIKRNNKSLATIIYPNPVTENLFINIANTTNDKAKISVFNSAGSKVISQDIQLSNGNNSFTINGIERLSKGIYQLAVIWEKGKTFTKQFSKL